MYKRLFIFLCLIYFPVAAVEIQTFYGPVDVDEPVLIELIDSPAFQRLKHIHQYGVAYYTTHREEFTRYQHSLGVFALLRAKGCSVEEQIAGLLHDVSHTVFSHVGDWIFNRQNQDIDYQNLTHSDYLEKSGLGVILRKYGYAVDQVQPRQEMYPALEQPVPTLCADRIDYNLQGAFHQGYITHAEAVRMFHEIQFIDGDWISHDLELLKKIVRYSLFMSQDCWGSGTNYVLSMWLAEAINRAVDLKALTMDQIRFGLDQEVWDLLMALDDSLVRQNMHKIVHYADYHWLTDLTEADLLIKSKFRGIDPWVINNGKRVPLTTTDPILAVEYGIAKDRMAQGWAIKLIEDEALLISSNGFE